MYIFYVFRKEHYNNNHLYSHILEYMKYPNRAIQCTKFLTITIQDKVCYKACNAINFMK